MSHSWKPTGLCGRVALRYRPGPDVLTATVDLSVLADLDGRPGDEVIPLSVEIETPDADCTVQWADMGEAEWLKGFSVVHAAARLRSGRLPASLPPAFVELLAATLPNVIATAREAVAHTDSPVARITALAESQLDVPIYWLMRKGVLDSSARPDLVAPVSDSLRRLAQAVHDRSPVDDELEAVRTDHLSRLLGELSSTLATSHGTPAPGTSAATREAVRGGVPLTIGEQHQLEQALDELADPARWNEARTSIERLADALESHERGGRPHRR
jgi:hypothetical protein